MANTYTQFYVHIVFATKHRNALVKRSWKDDLCRYITGIIQSYGHKLLAINCMPDHIHIFIGYNVNHLIPHLVEQVKTSSNQWVKDNKLSAYKFDWQKGYGAFSHSRSSIDSVVKYIINQEEHHRKKSFKEEYLKFLIEAAIEYDEKYMFEFFENIQESEF